MFITRHEGPYGFAEIREQRGPLMARKPGDHGDFDAALDYALDVADADNACAVFLRCWREGDLDGWPEFYEWLDKREADEKAWRKAERARLKGFRIGPAETDAGVRAIREQGNLPPAEPSISPPTQPVPAAKSESHNHSEKED